MFYYIYVIESLKNNSLYTGFTTNFKERIIKHNRGLNASTRRYKPWKFVYGEVFVNEKDARRRERYLKTSQGMRFLKRMMREYLYSKKSRR